MENKVEDFLLFLESIKEVDTELISKLENATIIIFESEYGAILEASAFRELGSSVGKAIPDLLRKGKKETDKVADMVPSVKRAIGDIIGKGKKVADDAKIKKSPDDIAKKLDDSDGILKKADDVKTKKSKIGKLAKGATLSGGISSLLGDGDSTDASEENEEDRLDSSAYVADSGGPRYWPTNFHTGTLTPEQAQEIDKHALFGSNQIDDDLISELDKISPLDEQDMADAAKRYAEVYEYWSNVYNYNMKQAYDDQMDKSL